MIKIDVTMTSLMTGYNKRVTKIYSDKDVARDEFNKYLQTLDESLPAKFLSAQRRVRKGTSRGIKIFYSPKPGVRFYLWIEIVETTDLL